MKTIAAFQEVSFPDNVQVEAKSRSVKLTGPRGTLVKQFKHLYIRIQQIDDKTVRVTKYHANRKGTCVVQTVISHIENMISGVTKGFRYKMRLVHAHFPINVNIENDGTMVEIRNFLGEKVVRRVNMLEGVKIHHSEKVKDELILDGNDIQMVSQSAASISNSVLVKHKDIRKFLDGIYVSEKTSVEEVKS
eukprot:TRINITY_DN43852_c0_g1_i1.p1 TRINITY_DN43852_c0_g1~~TRINITY_DN43852_c0_g1_i1.p1  ORF type:complete len:191 (-),score=5.44 TRINITY_DN43852_c0_g1_i1:454-1026(-)